MKRHLILTHGQFAVGIANSAEVILGQKPDLTCITVSTDDSPETIKAQIEAFVSGGSEGDSNIIMTDIPGGSTTRNAFEYAARPGTYVVSGLNLALLLEILLNSESDDVEELIRESIANAKKSFLFVNDMLKNQ